MLDNLIATAQALDERSWRPAPPVCFCVTKPKAREIHAAAFADRVVHHWLVPRLEGLYEPVFIHDVYSNRKGKGIHSAVDRLQSCMRAVHAGRLKPGYYLQLDIKSFFNSVDRPLLFKMIQGRLRKAIRAGKIEEQDARVLRELVHIILRQDVGKVARQVGDGRLLAMVPAHKRLVNAGLDKGLPIGNLTSQFFANVYLNELDQFIKHQLKCRYYLRYVDDFILLHTDSEQLRAWEQSIETFLEETLKLSLRTQSVLKPCDSGADFLGYIVRPQYRLVRKRVVGNLREKLHAFSLASLHKGPGDNRVLRLPPASRLRLQALLASYLGHFSHAHSEELIASLLRRYPWLGLLFVQHHKRLLPLWEPLSVSSYRSQIAWFRYRFPCACLRVQRGTEIDNFEAVRCDTEGMPASIRCRARLVVVNEQGYLKSGMKRRVLDRVVFADDTSVNRSGQLSSVSRNSLGINNRREIK